MVDMHLLYTSGAGVGLWPPVTVRSRAPRFRTGPGISSEMAVLAPAATTTDPS
jgi:hypothetical protein